MRLTTMRLFGLIDNAGESPGSAVEVSVPAGAAGSWRADELESGVSVDGALGDGVGKRQRRAFVGLEAHIPPKGSGTEWHRSTRYALSIS